MLNAKVAPAARAVKPKFELLPTDLRGLHQWILWKAQVRDGKPTKVPYRVDGRTLASTTDPTTWTTFALAWSAFKAGKSDGVGFVFTADDSYCGIDFDNCLDENGAIAADVLAEVDRLNSYTELSPSGRGLHVIVRAVLGKGSRKKKGAGLEIYDSGRYFTMSGLRYSNTPATISTRQGEVDDLLQRHFGQRTTAPTRGVDANAKAPEKIKALMKRTLFRTTWNGERKYPSDSERDLALTRYMVMAEWTDQEITDTLIARRVETGGKLKDAQYYQRTIDKARPEPALAKSAPIPKPQAAPWPVLDEAALYGLAGDFVRLVVPHCEADRAALLISFLVGVGNIIGRHAYWTWGGDHQYCNLYAIIAGETSGGAKGTSWEVVRRVLKSIDGEWADTRLQGGLSSGEGLVDAVRDAITRHKAVTHKGQVTVEAYDVPGVVDKRLLAVETEFARTLKVARRDGNILSEILCQAWESGSLRTMPKEGALKATGAHVSLLGHIVPDVLRSMLDEVVLASGFANRFLFVCSKRSKELAHGGTLHKQNLAPLVNRLRLAVAFGRDDHRGQMNFDMEAHSRWPDIYHKLRSPKTGLFGAIVARSVPIVRRLAVLYAVLDGSEEVGSVHLDAAVALWQYAEASARYIFGSALGDPDADRLLRALWQRENGTLTRDEICNLFGRHKGREKTERALATLTASDLIEITKEQSGGRPVEVVRLKQRTA